MLIFERAKEEMGRARTREFGMNPNLGENFIVYSRRVSTYKCPPRAIGNEIVNVRKGGGVSGRLFRYCGVEKGCHAGGGCAHDENRCILLPA